MLTGLVEGNSGTKGQARIAQPTMVVSAHINCNKNIHRTGSKSAMSREKLKLTDQL